MLIQESHVDVPTTADGQGTMRKYMISLTSYPPTIYPDMIKQRTSAITQYPMKTQY